MTKAVRRAKVRAADELAELALVDFFVNTSLRIPVLFLSLKFHQTFNEYIKHRIEHLMASPACSTQPPVLLLLVDLEDEAAVSANLETVSSACVLNGVRLLLGWSVEEAARLLEILHVFGPDRAGDIARGIVQSSTDQMNAVARDAVQTLQGGVGPKDATQLLAAFGSMKALILAGKEELVAVPSIGAKKSVHIFSVFNADLLE